MARALRRLAAGVAAGVCGLMLAAGAAPAQEKKDDFATIHDIMTTGHKGKKSLLKQVEAGVKDGDWASIEKAGKTLKKYGEDLGKNAADKGDSGSWKARGETYKKTMLAIAEGVEKKDAKKTTAALATMNKSCAACHKEHK